MAQEQKHRDHEDDRDTDRVQDVRLGRLAAHGRDLITPQP